MKLWRLRNLSIEGKIVVFKTLAISKIIHLALVTTVPSTTIALLNKIQQEFIWSKKNPKIKSTTLSNDFESGGLKNVDLSSKIAALQCSWIKRLFDDNFNQWKLIPLYLIHKNLGKNFKFHSNLDLSEHILQKFPKYYQEIFRKWGKYLSSPPNLPSTIANQFIWFNKNIKVANKSIYFSSFSKNGLNFVGQLFNVNGSLKNWNCLKKTILSSG